jgi:hypothetical protein
MASKKRKRRKQRPRPSPRPAQKSAAQPAAKSAAAAAPKDGRPPAPWGSFPVSEIVVAIGLVLLIGGLFLPPARGKIVIGVGLVLASLAGLELSIREHFSGYRSHTALLAGACGVATVALVLALGHRSLSIGVALAIGVGTGALAAAALIMSFRRRSGGASFRLR